MKSHNLYRVKNKFINQRCVQNDQRCNGFKYAKPAGGCILLVLNSFFISSTNQVSTTQVFYNSHTTTAKTIPVEMAQTLKGFWSFTELGSKTDLSGKKQTAYWPHSSSFWPSFSPGFVQGVSPLKLSGSAWIQVNRIFQTQGITLMIYL